MSHELSQPIILADEAEGLPQPISVDMGDQNPSPYGWVPVTRTVVRPLAMLEHNSKSSRGLSHLERYKKMAELRGIPAQHLRRRADIGETWQKEASKSA